MAKDTAVVSTVGNSIAEVQVSIGPQFLELFSEHLYSSPNKAFEELVSNSWDAGAQTVYVGVPSNLHEKSAAVWVLDDGISMDLGGIRDLWKVAVSPKRSGAEIAGRPPIGKFGIGKLATYILAHQLTYVCKATDGIMRAVTMDYRRIRREAEDKQALHIEDGVKLNVREITRKDLEDLLEEVSDKVKILSLIDAGVPHPTQVADYENEYGMAVPATQMNYQRGTWTLALLTSLKPTGQRMNLGRIRWLLRTALPLGSSMSMALNDEVLPPSKIDVPIEREWKIGEGLGISHVILRDGSKKQVVESGGMFPCVQIAGVAGEITGYVRLYEDKISGGKSDSLGSSNGFFINIRGRVINPEDPYFGLENLNHSTWAKFRATIRADGLNDQLVVHRGGLLQSQEQEIFQSFLLALFNKARNQDANTQASMPNVGEVLTKSWGVLPLEPLKWAVSEMLSNPTEAPSFVDTSRLVDTEKSIQDWEANTEEEPSRILSEVVFEELAPESPLVKYVLADRKVVVNRNHPFVRAHGESPEQQRLLLDAALVDLLTEAYMAGIGVDVGLINDAWQYRDKAFRLVTQVDRRTGPQIAKILMQATSHAKGFEIIVGDALEYLGFSVQRLAQSGQPEGVATAPTTPNKNKVPSSYKFTYDAKSSIHDKAKTKDISTAGLARHRTKHKADYSLVVAPGYAEGALLEECKANRITPMRAEDLAELLWLTAVTGPFDLNEFRSVFSHHHPDDVHNWVQAFCETTKSKPRVSLDALLSALDTVSTKIGPNVVTTSVLAYSISQMNGVHHHPTEDQIKRLISGLSVLVPDLVQVAGDKVFLSTSPQKLREAILAQVRQIPPKYGFGISELFPRD